jgi:hypothetical protein
MVGKSFNAAWIVAAVGSPVCPFWTAEKIYANSYFKC